MKRKSHPNRRWHSAEALTELLITLGFQNNDGTPASAADLADIIRQGDGKFWRVRTHKGRLYIQPYTERLIARRLGITLDGAPVAVPLADILSPTAFAAKAAAVSA